MKRGFRFQTGELNNIVNEIRNKKIPSVDADTEDEYRELLIDLENEGIFLAKDIGLDKDATDRVKFPEFQFRAAFYIANDKKNVAYIDFYAEEPAEETYPDIFGD
jgi:hypothetical protein